MKNALLQGLLFAGVAGFLSVNCFEADGMRRSMSRPSYSDYSSNGYSDEASYSDESESKAEKNARKLQEAEDKLNQLQDQLNNLEPGSKEAKKIEKKIKKQQKKIEKLEEKVNRNEEDPYSDENYMRKERMGSRRYMYNDPTMNKNTALMNRRRN